MNELVVGAIVAAISLVFVLWPIFRQRGAPPPTARGVRAAASSAANAAVNAGATRAQDANAERLIASARAALITCASCSAVCVEPNARFCPTCGARMPERPA